ncbi:HAUS augmin-like complex subunit [Musa troglodytarum]|uniref:HAUS augmin-like complex subunit n=1 Tax=Musa troglodytarum TaxID=320322 RepID=A0A9E7L924_9LILI|nr:HAUS augmin-like complex subunit [Musa troglodytarum]
MVTLTKVFATTNSNQERERPQNTGDVEGNCEESNAGACNSLHCSSVHLIPLADLLPVTYSSSLASMRQSAFVVVTDLEKRESEEQAVDEKTKQERAKQREQEEGKMSRSLGIPVKLLHEAAGHVVTVELKSGELYRGSMIECEDNWNCQLENITYTAKVLLLLFVYRSDEVLGFGLPPSFGAKIKMHPCVDGKVSQLEHVFIRGSKVRFMVIPDMLKNAPMFKRLDARIRGKGSSLGVGRGRAVAMRARAQAAGRGGAPTGRGVVPPIRRGGIIGCQCAAITRIADVDKKNPAPNTAAPSAIRAVGFQFTPLPHPTDVPPFLSPRIRPPRLLPRLAMKRGKSKADTTKKADTRLSVKKGGERATKKPRKTKAAKDPNKPKRPPSAFFVFMEEFRKSFKEKNPNNKSVSVVGKAGGDKWKSLSEAEKAPYVAKAAKLKTDYTKKIAAYNKNQSGGGSHAAADEDESDKSKSEVNDDDEEEEGTEEEEDDDDSSVIREWHELVLSILVALIKMVLVQAKQTSQSFYPYLSCRKIVLQDSISFSDALFLSLSFIRYVNYNLIGDRTRMNTISSAIVGYGETVPRSSGDRVRKEHICFAGRGKRSLDVSFGDLSILHGLLAVKIEVEWV